MSAASAMGFMSPSHGAHGDATATTAEPRPTDAGDVTHGGGVSSPGKSMLKGAMGDVVRALEGRGVEGEGGEGIRPGERKHAGVTQGEGECAAVSLGEGGHAGVTREGTRAQEDAGIALGDAERDTAHPGPTWEEGGDSAGALEVDEHAGVTQWCRTSAGFAYVQGPVLRVDERAQVRLQVLEPGALTVFPGDSSLFTLAVVGRGTEILTCDHVGGV